MWIITRGISNELEAWLHADVVLIDRAVPDALGYYLAALAYRHEQPELAALVFLETVVTRHSSSYDLILRTTLDSTIPVGTDKPRDNNLAFRVLADHHVARVLHEMRLPHELLPANAGDHLLARVIAFAGAPVTTWMTCGETAASTPSLTTSSPPAPLSAITRCLLPPRTSARVDFPPAGSVPSAFENCMRNPPDPVTAPWSEAWAHAVDPTTLMSTLVNQDQVPLQTREEIRGLPQHGEHAAARPVPGAAGVRAGLAG